RRHTRFSRDWSSDVCSSDLGTYPLPEAQLDRFLLHVLVGYPDAEGERAILALNRAEARRPASDRELFASPDALTQDEVLAARQRSEERRVGTQCRSWWKNGL